MTTAEAAAALGVHRSRVLHWIGEGRLRATKRGRDWWVTAGEVERFKSLDRPKGRPREKDAKDE